MEISRTLYFVCVQYLTLVLCERRANVGQIDLAPKYGTYPYLTSNDIYMDPCKAREYLLSNFVE